MALTQAERNIRRRERLLAAGLCTTCGKRQPRPNLRTCEQCGRKTCTGPAVSVSMRTDPAWREKLDRMAERAAAGLPIFDDDGVY